jgi:hypothetical protein
MWHAPPPRDVGPRIALGRGGVRDESNEREIDRSEKGFQYLANLPLSRLQLTLGCNTRSIHAAAHPPYYELPLCLRSRCEHFNPAELAADPPHDGAVRLPRLAATPAGSCPSPEALHITAAQRAVETHSSTDAVH